MNHDQFEILLGRLDRIEDRLEQRIDGLDNRVSGIEDSLSRYKGWVAAFTAITAAAGGLIKWG